MVKHLQISTSKMNFLGVANSAQMDEKLGGKLKRSFCEVNIP